MLSRILTATVTTCALAIPSALAAQTIVSVDVPFNLMQVSPDIERVRVLCVVAGGGLVAPSGGVAGVAYLPSSLFPGGTSFSAVPAGVPFAYQDLPMLGGQLVLTIRLNIPVPAEALDQPIGKTATHVCMLEGFSKSLQQWDQFYETHPVVAFRLKPTPMNTQGTFVW